MENGAHGSQWITVPLPLISWQIQPQNRASRPPLDYESSWSSSPPAARALSCRNTPTRPVIVSCISRRIAICRSPAHRFLSASTATAYSRTASCSADSARDWAPTPATSFTCPKRALYDSAREPSSPRPQVNSLRDALAAPHSSSRLIHSTASTIGNISSLTCISTSPGKVRGCQ